MIQLQLANKAVSQNKKHKRVIVLTDASSLSHLPMAAPLTIDELLESIDRLTSKRFDELSSELSLAVAAQILHSDKSIDELVKSSNASRQEIFALQQQQLIPDLEKLATICHALGGRLELTLHARNGEQLDCSSYLHNSNLLEAYLKENTAKLELHPLANAFCARCGLKAVPGIDGGALEKSHPLLFRLMRIAAFTRCKMTLNAVHA